MYKKILIKSEEDLPKENGGYFSLHKNGVKNYYYFDLSGGAFDNKSYWLKRIDWYLIESPISVPTEEEIDKRFPYAGSLTDYEAQIGAKWAIDEILKRNK